MTYKQPSSGLPFKQMGSSPVKFWGLAAKVAHKGYKAIKGLSKAKKAAAAGGTLGGTDAAYTAATDKTKNRSTIEKVARGVDDAFLFGAGQYVYDNRKEISKSAKQTLKNRAIQSTKKGFPVGQRKI